MQCVREGGEKVCVALKSARSGLFVSCAHFFSVSLSVVVLFTTLAHTAPKHTDVHVHVCVCVCVCDCVFNWKWSRVPSPCSALHPHSPWLHSTRPLELPEARGGCSSLCLLSCVSEWAQMCVCVRTCVCVHRCVCVCVNPTECMVKLKGSMFRFLRQYEWMYVGVQATCTFMLWLSLSESGQRHFFLFLCEKC